MNIREIIDQLFLEHADKVGDNLASILNSISRFDINSAEDKFFFVNGIGHLLGLPTRPGQTSTATTGVPTNSVKGFAPGALFINFLGSAGSVLYVNQGTFASSTWLNIA